jgi:glycosyltransferase involved in cell wall biosynthesis
MFFSPYAVDTHFFRRAASGSDVGTLREKLGIGKAERVVMFCGKVIEKKRPLDVVEALARLPADQRPVLMVVGDGPLRDAMRERARQAGVETRFVGFKNQTELPPYYALADLLVLPSDGGETWGLVVNEAMSCGTPALVSDAVGCGPDLIEPGKTGAVFRLGDIDDLANAIARSIDLKHDPAVQTALERKMAEYSIERAADGIVAAVEALGKRRH